MSDETEPTEALSKAERLAIGGAVAPTLRKRAGAGRRITLVDKDGKPVGVTDDVTVAKSLLARSEIEFSVVPGKRPEFVNCKTCGRPVEVKPSCRIPSTCRPGTHQCVGCGKTLGGERGKCSFGQKCNKCSVSALGKIVGGKNRRVTDDELREACAIVATYAEAAAALGMKTSSVSVRAGKLGISPGLAIPGESPKARGGRAALRVRGVIKSAEGNA